MIMYQLITDGELDFEHLDDVSPFMEWKMQKKERIDHLPSPRLIKTHLRNSQLSPQLKGKFIYIERNGKDVAVSQYYHCLSMNSELTFDVSLDTFFFQERESWFKHLHDWHHNPNGFDILIIHYEDLIDHLTDTIYKIADFCEIETSNIDMERVIERSRFSFMKEHQQKLSPLTQLKPDEKKKTDFFREGKKGMGKEKFNDTHITKYGEHYQLYLKEVDLSKEYEFVKAE